MVKLRPVLTNQQIIDRVTRFQETDFLRSLTCGNDSTHQPLVAEERDGRVVLMCKDCDYLQTFIPESVTIVDYDKLDRMLGRTA